MTVTITQRAHGVDLSKYDLKFDPSKATNQLDFAIQRVSYGILPDEALETIWSGVKNAPIRIAYHYLNSGVSNTAQLDAFKKAVTGKDFHAYAVDFEAAFNTLSYDFAKQAWDFIKSLTVDTGKRVFLYTNIDHYNSYIAPSGTKFNLNWNQVDLWVAQWFNNVNPNGQPNNPNGRTNPWSIWQYANSKTDGFLYGNGRVTIDLDVFNGTPSDMRKFLGIAEPEPTPTPEPLPSPTVSFSITDQDGTIWEANNVTMTKKI